MHANDIIAFFQQHPEFFDEHPEILNQLTVPHPVNGQAISLTERQLLTLREKLAQVQGKLAELVSFGEENDVIAEKVPGTQLVKLADCGHSPHRDQEAAVLAALAAFVSGLD